MKILPVLGLLCLVSVAPAACDTGTFMPVGTRTYRLDSGAGKSTMSIRTKPLSGDRMNVQTTVNGKTQETVWTCDASGLSASVPTGAGSGVVSFDAGFLPDTRKWKVGYSWTSNGTVRINAPGLGSMKMNTSTTGKS